MKIRSTIIESCELAIQKFNRLATTGRESTLINQIGSVSINSIHVEGDMQLRRHVNMEEVSKVERLKMKGKRV